MIAMVKGTLMEKSEGEAVVMTAGGLGLRVMCSMNTLAVLPAAGQECTLYTFMNVREDAMELFGFCQKEERDMFKRLTSVSGIGPRSALGVLGSMPLADLRLAILTGDAAALSRAARKRRSASVWSSRTSWRRMRFPARRDWMTRPLPSSPTRPHRTHWARRCWPLSRWDTRRRRRPRRSRASRGRRRRRMS